MSLGQLADHWLNGISLTNEGIGILLALGLIGLTALLVPRNERRRLRLAIGLLVAHVIVLLPTPFLDPSVQRWARLISFFFLLACLARAAFLLVMDGLIERRLGREVPQIFRDLIQVTLVVLAGLATMSQAGVDLTSLLATSALITAVIGLSLQETLGNTLAGLAMQAQPPFEVGDWIEIEGGRLGTVTSVGWRAITVWTNDDLEVTLPNSMLAKTAIINYSRPTSVVRRSVGVHAPYTAPPHHVEAVLLDAIAGVQGVLVQPSALVVSVGFAESGMAYELRYFITDFRSRDIIESLVRDRIWYAFRRENLTIPYPTHEVFLHEVSEHKLEREAEDRLNERVVALRGVDFLAELPDGALRDLALSARRKPYAASETVLEQGEGGDEFFVIRRGEVAVLVGDKPVAKLGPGQFFGEMSLMTGAPRAATVRTISACELVVVNKASMQEVLVSYPVVVERITAVLESRLHGLADAGAKSVSSAERDANQRALVSRIRAFFKLT